MKEEGEGRVARDLGRGRKGGNAIPQVIAKTCPSQQVLHKAKASGHDTKFARSSDCIAAKSVDGLKRRL